MNNIEQEVIVLKAVKELIDSMINYELITLQGTDPDSKISFNTAPNQILFNILLVDFLSCTDKRGPINQTSYLDGLHFISDNPSFNVSDSIEHLKNATQELNNWLEQEVTVDIRLPSIDKSIKTSITRFDFLKMTGNISKHNYLRAVGVADKLKSILAKSGVDVQLEEALLALTDFYERFHTDILGYHSSTIAEFLNNIRWGIYYYLQPEFKKSIIWESGEPPKYQYTYPTGLNSVFAKACYWELLNEVRSEPYIRIFKVTKFLKLRY